MVYNALCMYERYTQMQFIFTPLQHGRKYRKHGVRLRGAIVGDSVVQLVISNFIAISSILYLRIDHRIATSYQNLNAQEILELV